MTEATVFVSSLAEYNAGVLTGRWVSISELVDGYDPVADEAVNPSGRDEEFFITDYMDFPTGFEVSEYTSLSTIVDWYKEYTALFEFDWENADLQDLVYLARELELYGIADQYWDDEMIEWYVKENAADYGRLKVFLDGLNVLEDIHYIDGYGNVDDNRLSADDLAHEIVDALF